jgi:vacuolar-type H+-ATPase subunit E/Vma4
LKKHSISQIANDIKSAIAVITDELEKKGSISAGQIISRRRSINFDEYLQGMSQKCSKLGDMIELLTEEKRFEPLTPLDLNKAMKKLLREYQGEDFKLTFGLDERSFVDQTTGRAIKPIIRIGENDFQSLCRNIIDNAKRHGFFSRLSPYQ